MKPDEAVELAKQFLADPDKRAQVKVQLVASGLPSLADLIDDMAIVCRALLAQSNAALQPSTAELHTVPSQEDVGQGEVASAARVLDPSVYDETDQHITVATTSGEGMPGKTISYLYIELLRDRNAQLSLNERDAIADELAYVLSLREQRETPLTYPPEAASWLAIKGDKPVAVVEKAAYDDLRARFVAATLSAGQTKEKP